MQLGNTAQLKVLIGLQAKMFLDNVRSTRGQNVTFVGVHIRRGDYVTFMEVRRVVMYTPASYLLLSHPFLYLFFY